MTFSLCPVNEIKLLAFLSLFAAAFMTGPATGLILSRRHNWIGKLMGLAIGSAVGALAVVALAFMVDATGRDPARRCPANSSGITFPCGPPDLYGNVTLGWTHAVRGEGGGDHSDPRNSPLPTCCPSAQWLCSSGCGLNGTCARGTVRNEAPCLVDGRGCVPVCGPCWLRGRTSRRLFLRRRRRRPRPA